MAVLVVAVSPTEEDLWAGTPERGETSPLPVHEKICEIAAKSMQRSNYSVKILKTYDLVARVGFTSTHKPLQMKWI
jgi:hypothetical protein